MVFSFSKCNSSITAVIVDESSQHVSSAAPKKVVVGFSQRGAIPGSSATHRDVIAMCHQQQHPQLNIAGCTTPDDVQARDLNCT